MDVYRVIVCLAIGIAAANAIKCYICVSPHMPDCYNIPKGQEKHLVDCPEDHKYCAVTEEVYRLVLGHVIQKRSCSQYKLCGNNVYESRCCVCDTDGCNTGDLCNIVSCAISKKIGCVIISAVIVSILM